MRRARRSRWCNAIWSCLAGGLSLAAASCGRERAEGAPNGATAQAPGSRTGARELAEPTAFDLTASEQGAVLAWVEAPTGALRVERFDARGELQNSARLNLPGAGARDLVLAATPVGLSVIWRETSGSGELARGVWIDPAGGTQTLELGAAWGEPRAGRGNLAAVRRGGAVLALVRGPGEACGDGSAEACFGFRFYQLSGRGAVETGLGLRVPVPCDARAAQLISPPALSDAGAAAPQRFDYAVCTRSEQATVLTVFSIEPERSYAAAHEIFSGCTPLGAAYFAGQPLFVAECQGSRQMAHIPGGDAPIQIRNIDVRGLLCGSRGARVRLANEWLELDRPMEHLELLLDAPLSPPGARAAWTGSVLLVAQAQAGKLTLARHSCSGSELRSLTEE